MLALVSFSLAERVFIGKSIITIEDYLSSTAMKYSQSLLMGSYNTLKGLYHKVEHYHMAISYFFNVFCPTYGVTEDDVEECKEEYMKLSVEECSEVIRKSKLSEENIFGIYITH